MVSADLTNLIVDGVLILLLGAVLAACFAVNRRLGDVRGGQSELADLVGRLEAATAQSQAAIAELKHEAGKAQEALKAETAKARSLADELTLITEAGDNLANRLERRLTGARASEDSPAASNVESHPASRPGMLKALRQAR